MVCHLGKGLEPLEEASRKRHSLGIVFMRVMLEHPQESTGSRKLQASRHGSCSLARALRAALRAHALKKKRAGLCSKPTTLEWRVPPSSLCPPEWRRSFLYCVPTEGWSLLSCVCVCEREAELGKHCGGGDGASPCLFPRPLPAAPSWGLRVRRVGTGPGLACPAAVLEVCLP